MRLKRRCRSQASTKHEDDRHNEYVAIQGSGQGIRWLYSIRRRKGRRSTTRVWKRSLTRSHHKAGAAVAGSVDHSIQLGSAPTLFCDASCMLPHHRSAAVCCLPKISHSPFLLPLSNLHPQCALEALRLALNYIKVEAVRHEYHHCPCQQHAKQNPPPPYIWKSDDVVFER